MPTQTLVPVAVPQGAEQEFDQDFELDIRVSTVKNSSSLHPGGTYTCTFQCPTAEQGCTTSTAEPYMCK